MIEKKAPGIDGFDRALYCFHSLFLNGGSWAYFFIVEPPLERENESELDPGLKTGQQPVKRELARTFKRRKKKKDKCDYFHSWKAFVIFLFQTLLFLNVRAEPQLAVGFLIVRLIDGHMLPAGNGHHHVSSIRNESSIRPSFLFLYEREPMARSWSSTLIKEKELMDAVSNRCWIPFFI